MSGNDYLKVENSIFFNNEGRRAYGDFSWWGVECTFTISKDARHNREGNFYANPLFVDPENGDFRLRQGSPAINAGSSENLPDWLLTDYYGNSRIQDDTLDIGIFEGCVKTPVAKSPANNSAVESGVTEISLEWEWENTMPENISGYELEYVLNGTDTFVVSNLQSLTHNISGLKKTDKVQWRVRGINDTEDKNWSSWYMFCISRGYPLHVKANFNGDGSSWANAMDLQNALEVAVFGDTIWVASGTYKPTSDGDRSISFELKDGVHYYGGFFGDETELTQRNWTTNKTILSGDIGIEGDDSDNSYHVVTGMALIKAPITANTRLDGFIVESGNADQYGGALYLRFASPVISNTRFTNNQAVGGGAVYAER